MNSSPMDNNEKYYDFYQHEWLNIIFDFYAFAFRMLIHNKIPPGGVLGTFDEIDNTLLDSIYMMNETGDLVMYGGIQEKTDSDDLILGPDSIMYVISEYMKNPSIINRYQLAKGDIVTLDELDASFIHCNTELMNQLRYFCPKTIKLNSRAVAISCILIKKLAEIIGQVYHVMVKETRDNYDVTLKDYKVAYTLLVSSLTDKLCSKCFIDVDKSLIIKYYATGNVLSSQEKYPDDKEFYSNYPFIFSCTLPAASVHRCL